ncbi:hypothetical protein TcCL_ESM07157 [Trypanosoma cruzi]|nr:hypothetical protein TcCL_ESM07157 [Trypanosoma cruzi]
MRLTPLRRQSRFPWNDEGRKYRCDFSYVMLRVHKHLKATPETQPEEVTRSADGRQETARGCLLLLMKADDGSPIQSTTSHYSAQKSHRTADAPPDLSNCPTQSSRRAMELTRQRRSTVVRRNTGIPALGQLYEESQRGRSRDVGAVNVVAENVPSGAIYNLLPHARTDNQREEPRGLF